MKFKITKEMNEKFEDVKKVNIDGLEVEVKQYLPYLDKLSLAEYISTFGYNNSKGYFDNTVTHIARRVAIIERYTNIKNEDGNIVEFYDEISKTRFYENVIEVIPSQEMAELNQIIKHSIDDKKGKIDFQNAFSTTLDDILYSIDQVALSLSTLAEDGKLDNAMNKIAEEVEKLDPEKLGYVKKFLEVAEVD